MKYRDAKLLKEGDTVVSKETGATYIVRNIEVYGSVKTVRVNCNNISFLHAELKDNDEQI
jgi:hypothetical protein